MPAANGLFRARTGVTREVPLVRPAVGNHRPSVVAAGPDDVELVAALRAVFCFPDLAGLGMKDERHGIADAERVDLRFVSGPAGEGVVGGRGAVVIQPQHLAVVTARILRVFGRRQSRASAIGNRHADGHVDLAVAAEHETGGGLAVDQGVGREDVAHVGQLVPAVETAPGERRRRRVGLAGARLVVGEIHPAVLREARMQGDVVQPLHPAIEHRRDAGNRLGIEHTVTHNPEPAGPLGDEHAAVRKKQQAVRMRESLRRHDAEFRTRDGRATGPRDELSKICGPSGRVSDEPGPAAVVHGPGPRRAPW